MTSQLIIRPDGVYKMHIVSVVWSEKKEGKKGNIFHLLRPDVFDDCVKLISRVPFENYLFILILL